MKPGPITTYAQKDHTRTYSTLILLKVRCTDASGSVRSSRVPLRSTVCDVASYLYNNPCRCRCRCRSHSALNRYAHTKPPRLPSFSAQTPHTPSGIFSPWLLSNGTHCALPIGLLFQNHTDLRRDIPGTGHNSGKKKEEKKKRNGD